MPSAAFTRWQTDRMARLGHMDAHCAALFAPPPAIPPGSAAPPALPGPPPLAEESLQGYVMLLSGHFQGFCRDLYTECAQICAAIVPTGLRGTFQAQFAAELKLNTGNPTVENIRKDFERFGFLLDLASADQANPVRVTHLGHLNYWRNAVAHQKATPAPLGVPAVLILADIQAWRASCNGLATSLDDIMHSELHRILRVAPW
jgi:hypothetical protein